jgi:glycopeptide antibiotics resistance protein
LLHTGHLAQTSFSNGILNLAWHFEHSQFISLIGCASDISACIHACICGAILLFGVFFCVSCEKVLFTYYIRDSKKVSIRKECSFKHKFEKQP